MALAEIAIMLGWTVSIQKHPADKIDVTVFGSTVRSHITNRERWMIDLKRGAYHDWHDSDSQEEIVEWALAVMRG